MPLIQQRSRISTPKIPRWPYRINPSSWQANGLIGWYPLVGNLGYGYDFSLYGRNLDTNSGVTWTSDTEGGEVPLFDGASGLSSAAGNLYIPAAPRTFMIWAKPDVIADSDVFFEIELSGDRIQMRHHQTSGRWSVIMFDPGWNHPMATASDQLAVAGEWHHHTILSRSTTDHEIYFDGISAATSGTDSGYEHTSGVEISLGQENGGGDYYEGNLRDFRIYNYALSDSQLAEIHRNGHELFQEYGKRSYTFFDEPARAGLSIPVSMDSYRRRRVS